MFVLFFFFTEIFRSQHIVLEDSFYNILSRSYHSVGAPSLESAVLFCNQQLAFVQKHTHTVYTVAVKKPFCFCLLRLLITKEALLFLPANAQIEFEKPFAEIVSRLQDPPAVEQCTWAVCVEFWLHKMCFLVSFAVVNM